MYVCIVGHEADAVVTQHSFGYAFSANAGRLPGCSTNTQIKGNQDDQEPLASGASVAEAGTNSCDSRIIYR